MMRSSSKDMKRLNHLIGETEAVYHEMAVRFGLSDSAVRILYTICDYDDGTYCPLQIICAATEMWSSSGNAAGMSPLQSWSVQIRRIQETVFHS